MARTKLADAYGDAHNYVKAVTLKEEVLAAVTRQIGADHLITVSVLTAVANLWFLGLLTDQHPEMAIPLFEFVAAEWGRVAGADDPGALSARSGLANVYLMAGQPRRAIAMLESTLADCVRVLGHADSLTQGVRTNLEALSQVRAMAGGIPGRVKGDAEIADEVACAFAEALSLEPAVSGGRVSIAIPAIGETLDVPVCDVKRATRSFTPTGDAAVELVMVDGDGDVMPLIVLAEDVAFAPEDPVAVLRSPVPVVISDAPTLISYTGMLAQAERFAVAATVKGRARDRTLAGNCLLARCIIAGAVRFGMRPLRAVAWWQRGWEARHADWHLPPFPRDPVWDHLVRSASGITLTAASPAERANDETAVQDLTVTDFEALEPRLSVAQLDEEFVETWKAWVPITPASFARLLMVRLDGAQAEVAVYPDGAGCVDLVADENGEVQAVLQLRFDFRTSEMHIDEIRIPETARRKGLFQRLQYNTEQLSEALGLASLHVFATGMGAYAFAKSGWPRDRELYLKANPPSRA